LAKDYVAAHLQSRNEVDTSPALESFAMEPLTSQ
jgi:hypothetical protein